MDEAFDADTAAALAEAVRLDPTLAAEPERLRRALADLAPADERGGWLLTLGAAAGLPGLIERGETAEARARLSDLCACRADAAAWTVAAWTLALNRDLGGDDWSTEPETEPGGEPDEAEEPGAPTALSVAVWPGAGPVLGAVTMRGVFVLGAVGEPARGRWRRVATVRAPLSRDVALELASRPGLVVWSDHDGVRARALRRDGARLSLGAPRLLAVPPAGEQVRYPVAALGQRGGGLSVLWTADRRNLQLTEVRPAGAADGPVTVPVACDDGERLAGLDWCLETERTGWLLCRTDRGRLLAARWDLTVSGCGTWRAMDPPVQPAAAALATLGGTPFAVVASTTGDLLSLDVRAATAGRAGWHSIDRPQQIRRTPPPRVIAAGAGHDSPEPGGWLALAGGGGAWAMPVTRAGDIIECGSPVPVWTEG